MASIFGALFILFSSMAVGMLLIVLGGLLLPPAMAHVAVKRSFGAFFSVGAWWRVLRENFSGFLVAWAVFGLAYTALTLLVQFLFMTVVLCMLVPFVIMPLGVYTSWLLYRLVGQAYGQSQAEELPVERVPAAVGL